MNGNHDFALVRITAARDSLKDMVHEGKLVCFNPASLDFAIQNLVNARTDLAVGNAIDGMNELNETD